LKNEIAVFLEEDLPSLCCEEENDERRSFLFCVTIGAADEVISEKYLKDITNNCLSLTKEETDLYISAFLGMSLLKIICDCDGDFQSCLLFKCLNHRGYSLGRKFKFDQSEEFKLADTTIENLRMELAHL
jgi:hypothetical protein